MLPGTGAVAIGDMVTSVVAVVEPQPPEADIVYVTIKVPALLVVVVIAPVPGLIVKPAGAENVPPVVPVRVTVWIPSVVHHGEPEYEIDALGRAVIVIGAEADATPQPPEIV
jgi:hypothetical protein